MSCINGECENCYNDDGKVHIVVNSHNMSSGKLMVDFVAEIPDPKYPDKSQRRVHTQALDIELVNRPIEYTWGCGCEIEAEMTIPLAVATAFDMAVAAGYKGTREDYVKALMKVPELTSIGGEDEKTAIDINELDEMINNNEMINDQL